MPQLVLAAAITAMGLSFVFRGTRAAAASRQFAGAGIVVTAAGAVMIVLSAVALATGR
ncbi:MAG TPA: hypothetical protein VF155_08500 [Candidatus Dormibacteraeota bacterium]